MHDDIAEILLTEEAIAARVRELAGEISAGFGDGAHGVSDGAGHRAAEEVGITLVPIMTGSIIFVADLVRQLPIKLRIETMTVSSYPGRSTVSQGATILDAVPQQLGGRHVVIVDDILDSGRTLRLVRESIEAQQPASVRTCVLLRKRIESALATPCEHVGFDIPDVFVVGYGLDYDDHYRNLPFVGVLRKEAT